MNSEFFPSTAAAVPSSPAPIRRHVVSVSELTLNIKHILEEKFEFIWVSGEISNFKIPASGHAYFTLKDAEAQIAAVMFRGPLRSLRFTPADGFFVVGLGRISVYPPRGTYQVIFEYLEPMGSGALQQAFDALKSRLAAEGLFDASRKRPLPMLPRKISVVTSFSGAVIHDICKVAGRRFPNMPIQLVPAAVQGPAAVDSLVRAIGLANRDPGTDLIILARGGGSIEDLQAFNSELLTRAIAGSRLPVVSAVGHETDFTIADLVADLRAPTPSAAAEIVVPAKSELEARCQHLTTVLTGRWRAYLSLRRARIGELAARLAISRRRIDEARLRIDDLAARMTRTLIQGLDHQRDKIQWLSARLAADHPRQQVVRTRERLAAASHRLIAAHRFFVARQRGELDPLAARLAVLSPLAVLERGYSITRRLPGHDVVRDAAGVAHGTDLEILLARGKLRVTATRPGRSPRHPEETENGPADL